VSASKGEFYARIRIGLHDFQNAHAHTDKFNWPKSRRFTGEFKNDCWTLADEGLDFKFDSKK
jgi:hypothetical protein